MAVTPAGMPLRLPLGTRVLCLTVFPQLFPSLESTLRLLTYFSTSKNCAESTAPVCDPVSCEYMLYWEGRLRARLWGHGEGK